MNTLEADLKARWRPSEEQVRLADSRMILPFYKRYNPTGDWGIYTLHVLTNKRFGIWTADVGIRPIEGISFLSRDRALAALQPITLEVWEQLGRDIPVTGGYTWHSSPGQWAVFEDILARHPEG